MKDLSLGRDLIRSVVDNQLGDVVFDAVEVALDNNLAEGFLRDFPIIGTVVKLARAGQSISEGLFIRKLICFLRNLKDVSHEDRARFLEKYPDSTVEQRVLGENLLLALERLDSVDKPAILARFFSAYMASEIDYAMFIRFARALEKFNMELLPNLRWFYTREEPAGETPEEIIHELSLAGLVTVALSGSGAIGGVARYCYSSLEQ